MKPATLLPEDFPQTRGLPREIQLQLTVSAGNGSGNRKW